MHCIQAKGFDKIQAQLQSSPTVYMLLSSRNVQMLVKSLGLAFLACNPALTAHGSWLVRMSSNPYHRDTPSTGILISRSPQISASDADGAAAGENAADACVAEPYATAYVDTPPFPPLDPVRANVYRYRRQYSVNIGSWFVHEKWMTPSPFKCADGEQISELDIASGWGSVEGARSALERHWDTFITEADFGYLAGVGINTVRLPIGYWSLGPSFCVGTAYEDVADVYQNAWPQVLRAIRMADDQGIGILIDLHGAVGSQNGEQHSGISDGMANLFDVPENQEKTLAVLRYLVQELVPITNVVGIQILNEPHNVPELVEFYETAIDSLRKLSPEAAAFPFYIHDGFDLNRFSSFISSRTDFVVQDHHSYFVFTPSDQSESADDHTSNVEGSIAQSLLNASEQERLNLVIDEWSCALTPESLESEEDPESSAKEFCFAQLEVYNRTAAGWGFWSYKKEDCDDDPGWCFTSAVGRRLPPSFSPYGLSFAKDPVELQEVAIAIAELSDFPNPQAAGSIQDTLSLSNHLILGNSVDSDESWETPGSSTIFHEPGFPGNSTTCERSGALGYADGYQAAKVFAMHGFSKLGFVSQYAGDSRAAYGQDVISEGLEECYKQSFLEGLEAGEEAVLKILQQ
ncbi:glycoside hydrolase superfamily [Gloeopeniophorella convolvens]|nr:glycoside hydrolase superfamily [Gloeopeniophorella convolvens]